jgi:hypothetical protein
MNITDLWRRPSALRLAVRELEETQISALLWANHLEDSRAKCEVLKARVARLRVTIAELSQQQEETK